MAAVTTTVPPFFEPGAPSPMIPVLTSQTEFINSNLHSTILTEELPRTQRVRHATPTAHKIPLFHAHSPSPHSTESSISSDNDNTGDSTASESDSEDGLIAKPPGEAGRPGRGGYNLEIELAWDSKKFHKLKVSSRLPSMLAKLMHFK